MINLGTENANRTPEGLFMRKLNRIAVPLMFLAALLSLHRGARGETLPDNPDGKVAQMNNAFGTDLYAQLSAKEGNLFFSPTSIQIALAMTWAGARGQTADEMARTLHLDGNDKSHEALGQFLQTLNADGKKGGYELAVSNALWGAKGYSFMPAYLATVEKDYGGHLTNLDYASDPEACRKMINDWVAGQTRDKIQDLMPFGSIDRGTRLVLTNAIYFKGKWDLPFDKKQTQDGDFTLAGGQTAKIPLMFQSKHFRYAEDENVQVLELPYGHNDLAMQIFLPKAVDGLPAFEKSLTADRIAALTSQLASQDVRVWLPRFKLENGFEMADVLKAMGMTRAFSNQADFSGMSSAESLFISRVIHKAFVNVDEEGTEATAATGIVMAPTGMFRREPPKIFRADHPFVFVIVHQKTGAILFMGRLSKSS
jgi:serpin B